MQAGLLYKQSLVTRSSHADTLGIVFELALELGVGVLGRKESVSRGADASYSA